MQSFSQAWQNFLSKSFNGFIPVWIYFYPIALVAVAIIIAFLFPAFGRRWFNRCESLLCRLAAGRQSYLFIAVTVFLLSAGLCVVRFPQPSVHDEFSYLLASDTFVRGRLTNPAHPLWQHFETFYVNHQPTYASKYPPGQGMIMALGTLLGGHPIVGVWLSLALAGMAFFWSMKSFFPAKWALIGSLLAITHPHITSWGGIYWGGAIALTGGALVIGATYRAITDTSAKNAFWLGAGLFILSLSRPFEGLAFFLATLLIFGIFLLPGKNINQANLWCRFLPVLLLVGCLNAGFLLYYNWRVTGNPRLMPYTLNHDTYWRTPLLIWQSWGPKPTYRHKVLEDFYPLMALDSIRYQTWSGIAASAILRVTILAKFIFFSPALLAVAFFLPFLLWRSKITRMMLAIWVAFFGLTLLSVVSFLHYYAPAMIIFFIVTVLALRHLRTWKFGGKKTGLLLARLLILASFFCIFRQAYLLKADYGNSWAYRRAAIKRDLENTTDQHLVIVKYGKNHLIHEEWVYNDAEIDSAKIVWAHDMGEEKNKELLDYFNVRKFWLLEQNSAEITLKPYEQR